MDKTRHDNFIRIAEKRTNKIIDMIDTLGNLSNKSFYDYSQQEIESIFDAIQIELDTQRSRFEKSDSKKRKFEL